MSISPGHVLITGASSGIGEATARAFAGQGLKLTLVARRRDRLEALADELGDAHVLEADLSVPSRAAEVVAEAEKAHGPIDHLVNNAGRQIVDYGHEIDPDQGEAMMALNLLTPLRLIRACTPGMKARGQGSVVNISSVAAFAAPLGMAWYASSKAGLAAASETLHGELKTSGVHVVTVYPGPVRTDMGAYGQERVEGGWAMKLQQWGTPERLGELIVEAVKRRRARVVYPKSYGPVRHVPGPVRWALDRLSPSLRS